ncbi:MAG TPA: condensation domain-containing protein [Dongiaceae bacterium]|nr:condensation domain-containing protein [Dongiaceae bacterium]
MEYAIKEGMDADSRLKAVTSEPEAKGDSYAFPLSPAQERIWLASQEDGNQTLYNGSFRMNLAGPVDIALLEQTFNEIVLRHEILRATVARIDGRLRQIIAPELKLLLAYSDLRSVSGERREEEMDRVCLEEARKPFDLERGPLVRVGVLRMEDERFILMLTAHQIICDGWSIGLIMEELQKIYAALASKQKPDLPENPVQFVDFVVWQQECSTRPEIQQQVGYWKNRLRRYHRLELPADVAGANRASSEAAIISHLLPRTLTDKLKDFSTAQGGTFFITTLAACLALLHRYTGEEDLSVGSPLAGRNRSDLETLVGQFVNHVIFRADAAGSPTFPQFCERVREAVWEAFANQDVPFEQVVSALSSGKRELPKPLFAINFICQREYGRASTFNFDFAGVRMSTMPSKTQGALYDLNFFIVEREAGWRLSLEYKPGLYTAQTANKLLDHFKELLEGIAENANRPLAEFPLTGLAPVAHNAPAQSGEPELYAMPASPVQRRFWLLDQLEAGNPAFHMPACVRITGDLNLAALEKSFQRLIERHETLRTTFREVDGELAQIISTPAPFVLPVSDLSSVDASQIEAVLKEQIRQEALEPLDLQKGPTFRARLFRLGPQSHALMTTIHHILADGWSNKILQDDLWNAYHALAAGKEPALAPLSIQYSDFAAWQKDWMESAEAQEHLGFWMNKLKGELPVLDFPTDRPPSRRPASHGAIETQLLPADLVGSLEKFGKEQEATMFALLATAFGLLLSRYSQQDDLIIGCPVANRRPETEPLIGPFAGPACLRLDFSGNPTLGEALRRTRDTSFDALNHTDFPFEAIVEHLKVRTVHGRKPFFQFYFFYQVAFLQARHEGALTVTPMSTVSTGVPFELQLAVIKREEGLRAQLEYNPDLFDAATIRRILDVYTAYLQALVNHPEQAVSALPAPEHSKSVQTDAPDTGRAYVPPRDEIEANLVSIWEQLFEQPNIGIRDDFFDLGGQSLLAAELMSAIEKKFDRKINLSRLVAAPTIEGLAEELRQSISSKASFIVPLRASGTRVPLFCIHCGTGHVLRYRAMTALLSEDQPVFGVRAPDIAGDPVLPSVEDLAALYLADIRAVRPHGPYQLCGLSFGGVVAFEVASRLRALGEEVSVLALFDTGNPAYYRDVPFRRWIRVRTTYLVDRLRKYGRRIVRGEGKELLDDARQFFSWRKDMLMWKLFRKGAPQTARPASRDSVIMFTNIGKQYTPKPYPGRIDLFRAEGRTAEFGSDSTLGWDEIAREGVEVHHVPGKHVTILEPPHVSALARVMGECLARTPHDGHS